MDTSLTVLMDMEDSKYQSNSGDTILETYMKNSERIWSNNCVIIKIRINNKGIDYDAHKYNFCD